jgi:hypothetical protein
MRIIMSDADVDGAIPSAPQAAHAVLSGTVFDMIRDWRCTLRFRGFTG